MVRKSLYKSTCKAYANGFPCFCIIIQWISIRIHICGAVSRDEVVPWVDQWVVLNVPGCFCVSIYMIRQHSEHQMNRSDNLNCLKLDRFFFVAKKKRYVYTSILTSLKAEFPALSAFSLKTHISVWFTQGNAGFTMIFLRVSVKSTLGENHWVNPDNFWCKSYREYVIE